MDGWLDLTGVTGEKFLLGEISELVYCHFKLGITLLEQMVVLFYFCKVV